MPITISVRALREYAAIFGLWPITSSELPPDATLDRCRRELTAILAGARLVKTSATGLLEYAGSVPPESRPELRYLEPRLVLMVSPEASGRGDSGALVTVRQRGVRAQMGGILVQTKDTQGGKTMTRPLPSPYSFECPDQPRDGFVPQRIKAVWPSGAVDTVALGAGVSISTDNDQPITTAPPEVVLALLDVNGKNTTANELRKELDDLLFSIGELAKEYERRLNQLHEWFLSEICHAKKQEIIAEADTEKANINARRDALVEARDMVEDSGDLD